MAELVTQQSALPTRKVTASIAGGVASVIAFIVLKYWGYEIPDELMGAVVVIVSAVLAYFTRESADNASQSTEN